MIDEFLTFINSQFFSSVFGSLLGAGLGAFTAIKFAEKSALKADLIREIRETNAAIALAVNCFYGFFSSLHQHVHKMYKDHERGADNAMQMRANFELGLSGPNVHIVSASFVEIAAPYIPSDLLRDRIFEKLALSIRPLLLIGMIEEARNVFEEMNMRRNNLITEFRKAAPADSLASKDLVSKYYGLADEKGRVDTNYSDCLSGMYLSLCDGVYFSRELCHELRSHGLKLSDAYHKKFGPPPVKVTAFEFEIAENSGLMPKKEEYESWESQFIKSDS